MTKESQTKPDSSENLKRKSSSNSDGVVSDVNKTTEYAENGPIDASKNDEMIESSSMTAGESTLREAVAKQENIEANEEKSEDVDGKVNEQRAGSTTSGSTRKSDSETSKERDVVEVRNEEEVKENKDSVLENEDVRNTNITEKETAGMETPAVTANEEKDSENSKELLEVTNKEEDGGEMENGDNEENVENSDVKIAENVVEGVPVSKEDKDEQSEVVNNSGNKDDETPVISTTGSESDAIETGPKSSRGEQVEKHEDENENNVDNEGNNIDNQTGQLQVEEENKEIQTKQDCSKESEMAINEGIEDDKKDSGSDDAAIVKTKPVAENIEKETEHHVDSNGVVAEDLVEKGTENSNEDLSKKDNVENEEQGTPDKTSTIGETSEMTTESKENESEIPMGPEAALEGSHENHSQVLDVEDNKSEVPSENIDDLVDELLAETDDVDAGKNDKESLPENKVEEPVVPSECSELKSDDVGEVEDAKQQNSVEVEKGLSEHSNADVKDAEPSKETEKGVASDEHQNSVEVEKDLSEHSNADVKDAEPSKETEKRVASGSVYRVQTDYLTRQVIAKQEKEIYLEEKLTETSRDLEIAERKVKDLQLRLKRFVKDDEAKDHKIRQMEKEYKDLHDQMQRIEESLDSKSKNNNVGEAENVKHERQSKRSRSKVCVVL